MKGKQLSPSQKKIEFDEQIDEDKTFLRFKQNPGKSIKFEKKLNTHTSTKSNAMKGKQLSTSQKKIEFDEEIDEDKTFLRFKKNPGKSINFERKLNTHTFTKSNAMKGKQLSSSQKKIELDEEIDEDKTFLRFYKN